MAYGGGPQQSFQPAAPHTSLITGRIRVDYRNGGTLGYISKFTMKAEEYVTTPDKAKALVVAFAQSRDPHEMIIAVWMLGMSRMVDLRPIFSEFVRNGGHRNSLQGSRAVRDRWLDEGRGC